MTDINKKAPLVPVILSGGAGTRLWPVSRRAHPKPFMKLLDGESLAEKTMLRAAAVSAAEPILTVTSRDYYFYTRDCYNNADRDGRSFQFLLEPMGRNTAPAIALAALSVQQQHGAGACMLILPADHLIRDQQTFSDAVATAHALARDGLLVTFGIHPTHAETGYGYIRQGEMIEGTGGHRVAAFVEKPDEATARHYFESGEYQWNSGMFCFAAGALLAAMKEHASEVFESVRHCWESMDTTAQPLEIPAELFADCPSISIDYAVMEQANNCAVVRGDFGWSDIGSWKAISELYESDEAGNSVSGKAVMVDTKNCFIQSGERLIAAVGVNDLVIVDTGDAVLIADRDNAQDVKHVVDQLTDLEHEAAIFHKTVHRPWGSYTILEDNDDCKVKRLVVKPGQVLSLQLHHRRSEHWTVIRGTAKIRLGDDELQDVHLIEVQTGDYFGEDDIERFEDIYGRVE
jgi:mannose-1-phosphate guanylyltransferase/mannose-6-phosphate isomerase